MKIRQVIKSKLDEMDKWNYAAIHFYLPNPVIAKQKASILVVLGFYRVDCFHKEVTFAVLVTRARKNFR